MILLLNFPFFLGPRIQTSSTVFVNETSITIPPAAVLLFKKARRESALQVIGL
jgi:hypothetical protein